ncbi:50S ribosomal protein L32e [Candidatus Woesearchaeota archaeon]|nr:50S ribosomal protein L32e [Candidatus Woesearchaeota archaeon]
MAHELLQLRNRMKRRKPRFMRQQGEFSKRVGIKWREPKGGQSKMRLKKAGKRRVPSIGFGSPKKVRGLHSTGLRRVRIANINELRRMNPKEELAVLLMGMGMKKKIQLLDEAKKLGIKILNIKNEELFRKKVEERIKKKKIEKKSEPKKEEKKHEDKAEENKPKENKQ